LFGGLKDFLHEKTLLTLALLLLTTLAIYATGPSNMAVIIEPISINSNGDVLCKASHYLNKEGALMQMPLTYSFLVIHVDRSITEYEWYYLNTLGRYDWDAIEQELEKWSDIFDNTNLANMPEEDLVRIKEYNFLNVDMEQFGDCK